MRTKRFPRTTSSLTEPAGPKNSPLPAPAEVAGRLRRERSQANVLWHASPFLPVRVAQGWLIGFFHENKCSPLHNGRASANEGDVDIFDLAFLSPS